MNTPTQSNVFIEHHGDNTSPNCRDTSKRAQVKTRCLKPSQNKFKKDRVAVSEAIGTVLMLAIAIVLVGFVSIWAYSLEMPEDKINVDLTSKIETKVIEIKHIGGEQLDELDTRITIIVENINYFHYKFADSENNDLKDGKWTIGETWIKDLAAVLAAYTNPKIDVFVIDLKTDEILLSQTVHEGAVQNLPDLAITPQDIEFEFQDKIPIIGRWVNITASVWNIGNAPANNVIVRFFDNNILLKRDGNDYQVLNISNTPGNNYKSTWVNFTTGYWGKRIITVKVYTSLSEINYRNNFAVRELYIEPKLPTYHGPDLEVSNFDIIFSDNYPVHGEKIQMTVYVHNTGDEDIHKGTTVKVRLFDNKGHLDRYYQFSIGLAAGLNHPCNFGTWDTRPGGISIITVEVDTDDNVVEIDETNNNASRAIQIMPTIIVVDDDEANAGNFDVFEEMSSNLKASGVTYKWTKTDDGLGMPNYDSGQYPLKNYVIIIWMTGYITSNTLTAKNIAALNQSLNNGSYLWLIGQDILSDIDDGDSQFIPGDFAYDYLGVDQYLVNGT
ncbi:MAG: type IV pilin, partial [Thermoplasmata archaeon]|nr:type IV pilin [Thermoplasmata archaeon]